MTTVLDLHNKAMDLVNKAEVAHASGDFARGTAAYRRALKRELEAIDLLRSLHPHKEPSWSVMHCSAASVALRAGDFRTAEKLIGVGLASDTTDDVLEELRDLLDEVQYRRHLDLRGIELTSTQFQLSLSGKAVGHGTTTAETSVKRIQNTTRLIERTAERKAGIPFRLVGGLAASVRSVISVEVSESRAASYAITFSVARRHEQLPLLAEMRTLDPVDVVDELFECVRLLQDDRIDDLKARIGDGDYFTNFLALARALAPDGTNVKTVGLTRGLGVLPADRVALRRPAAKFGVSRRRSKTSDETRITGVLDEANGRSAQREHDDDAEIAIIDDHGERHPVRVPRALVADLVRPNYGDRVTAIVQKRGNHRVLVDLFQATNDADIAGSDA